MRFFTIVVSFVLTTVLQAQPLTNDSFQLTNSLYDEQNPVMSPDGKTLFFTIGNHPQNIGSKKDPGDIWFSRLVGDQWTAPVHGGALLNDRAYNAVAGFSADGTQLFLHGHYDPTGVTARTQGISVSRNTGNGWTRPENITIPYFLNKSRIVGGFVSADNRLFVFSAETYGTHGVEDIYVSFNNGTSWTEPKNLGNTINTQFQELCPSLSNDGKTLYFSSNGRKGLGSFDVYTATRLDDSWLNWSAPVSMGININSEGRELFYRVCPSTDVAIFTSTKNSDGYGDIKFYKREDAINEPQDIVAQQQLTPDTAVKIIPVNREPLNDKLVKVYGKVTNSKTGEPVAATVSFAGPALNTQTTSNGAGFSVAIPSTAEYVIKIEAHGFVSTLEKLDIHTYEMQELEMNFRLQPVEVGTTVNLRNVLFVQTKTEILPESYPELDLVVSFLKENPNVKIELAGHTDNRGVHADNVKLSQQRVNKVKAYLVSKGIDPKRIAGKGYGGTKPIASNDTEESRRMNRRVEFTIKRF
ncbi:MAG: OmpA family protein [Bacteroidota bacterium]